MSEDGPTRSATPWLAVVGALPDGTLGGGPAARRRLAEAEAVFGAERLLAAAGVPAERRVSWPSPFAEGLAAIAARRGRPTAVLASGDPMHFGVGATLARRHDPAEMTVHPAPSAFSLAAARLGWPLEGVACLSLHDRPVETLHPHVAPGRRILALTRDDEAPAAVARTLAAWGYGASAVTVLEALGGPEERITTVRADGTVASAHPLNTVAIVCRPAEGKAADPAVGRRGPGLPDDAFRHDGQITKADVRAITLAALAPRPGERLWDVGAGSGAIAIEWCRAADGAVATAFERDPARAETARANAARLGATGVTVVPGEARETLAATRERPEAVFLGGAIADEAVFAAAWEALAPGGRLVSNAVTLAGEAASIARRDRHGGTLRRIAIEIAEPVGGRLAFRPRMPVVQWRVEKDPT